MRELKFRAWDGNELVYDVGVSAPLGDGTIEALREVIDEDYDGNAFRDGWTSIFNECVIEQFTGLHDRNGKEIYEGDIVKFYDYDMRNYVNRQVYFDEEFLKFGLKNTFKLFHVQFGSEFECVGNIHENPELLDTVS